MGKILSPVTKKDHVKHLRTINIDWIVEQWKGKFDYDVRYLFNGLDSLELFQCVDTGYSFYYPAVMGDAAFYKHCQTKSFYYMPWKWEHEQAVGFLTDNISIIEIGCAEGHFLEKLTTLFNLRQCVGLEMNIAALEKAREKGLNVHSEILEEHAQNNKNKYDVLCSFQTLEHIADVHSFIEHSLSCLKKNGKLIISVPNNQSFISETDQILNMPPHHVGLWDQKSLQSIVSIFNLRFDVILFEPIQKYHVEFFKRTVYRKVIGKKFDNRLVRKFYRELFLKPFVDKYIEYCQKWIPGHTVLAVYSKI